MKRTLVGIITVILTASTPSMASTNLTVSEASAENVPLWIRKNSISPDGEKIAFAYQGDIFVVSVKGGKALQITSNPEYDSDPIWTPDSRNIVFSSYREGGKDIFTTSCEGGTPKRITDHPASETPLTVTKDGSVIYSANIQQDAKYSGFPGNAQIYAVKQDGGRPWQVTSLPIASLSFGRNGICIYEDIKGYEDEFRKHHTSSVTRDIWLYKPQENEDSAKKGNLTRLKIDGNGTFCKLSGFKGEDRNPVLAADGDTYYYISEESGSFNIFKSSIGKPAPEKLTSHEKHPVRYLSVADNGLMAYSFDGELYTFREGGTPEKVRIEINKDSNEKKINHTSISTGITAISPSPECEEIAIVARGDVFVSSTDFKMTKRITNTPEQERDVCFSKDGRTIYYSAERDGHWGIYQTSLKNKGEKMFTFAFETEEKMVTKPGETCFQPIVSPDGESLAFLRDRTEIVVKNIKSGKEKSLLKGVNYSYTDGDQTFAWSPDSRYIICNYQIDGGWNNEDIAIIEVETGKTTNLTESGYTDSNFRWALGGKAMTWMSDRAGYKSHGSWGAENDIYLMFFDGKEYMKFCRDELDAKIEKAIEENAKSEKEDKKEDKEKKDSAKAEKKVEKLVLDFENRHDRTVRLTRFSGRMGDYFLSPDGEKLFYITRLENSYDLCQMNTKTQSVKVLDRGVTAGMYPDKDGKYIYMVTRTGISRFDVASGSKKSISFRGEYDYKPAQEREYIFNHIWKQVEDKFYDPEIHGIDWAMYKEAYRKFLPYIANNFDFQEMLSEMLGELNGSHTGARYRSLKGVGMGTLGVLYDEEYEGDGLKIKEVLKGGVLNVADPEIKAGDMVLAINGEKIRKGESWYRLLTRKGGTKTMVTIQKKGKKPADIYVEPAYNDQRLMYRRWIRHNEELVEKLSGGKVGYVHVQGMDSDSFREVYSKLLGKYRACEAVVVDTRHNGGGWLHDDLATLLSGKAYIKYQPRGQYICTDPFSKWTKPSCVLVGEDNYSDASGFPYVYKTLGIGKLIGAPVPGTMTAVWWETQIDPTLVFGIPQVGTVGLKEGRYLENLQVEPDIEVYNDPASELNGQDKQLEAAVKEMLKEIK